MNTEKQDTFLAAVAEGRNVYLSGKAGTGKSFITKRAIELLQESGKKVIAVAPTGVAANNIGGQTIHSTFALNPYAVLTYDLCHKLRSEKARLLKSVSTILIDEVSMLRPDILDAIHWTLKKNGVKAGLLDKQVIFIGDLKQLPVIIDDNFRSVLRESYDGDIFFNAQIYNKLNVETIELDQIMRQSDPDFIEALNIVRDGGKSAYFKQFVHDAPHGVILAPHNETVKAYNENGLSKIESQEIIFTAKVEGNAKAEEFNLESTIKMKHGAPVMYLSNSRNNPLVNGTLGTFVVQDGKYFIKVEGTNYALEVMKFTKIEYVYNAKKDMIELQEIGSISQIPIKLAYALSIHKSQGLTFDEVTVDLSRPCFAEGQMYVALSRVKTPAGLRILVNRK